MLRYHRDIRTVAKYPLGGSKLPHVSRVCHVYSGARRQWQQSFKRSLPAPSDLMRLDFLTDRSYSPPKHIAQRTVSDGES